MIVGNDECGVACFGQAPDARSPGLELLLGVKIVVALRGRHGGVVAEPGVIAAAVEADVGDAPRGAPAGLHGTPDYRLIDVAESDAALMQHRVESFVVPRGMA